MSRVGYVEGTAAILAELRRLIDAADEHIVLQMYLFAANGQLELLLPRAGVPPHAELVAGWLIEKRRQRPELPIVVILDSNTPSDPARTRSGEVPLRSVLERAGISVLHANLFRNRFDARRRRLCPAKSFHLGFEDCPPERWVERQNRWQVLHNLEDHRKNLVIDAGRAGLVSSHNLIDVAGDWHDNAFSLEGAAARSLWVTATAALGRALELPQAGNVARGDALKALARTLPAPLEPGGGAHDDRCDESCRLLDAEAIRPELSALFGRAAGGDTLYVATAYFSDLGLFAALSRAAERGAVVKILIDDVAGLPLPPALSLIARNLVNHEVTRSARRFRATAPGLELRVHDSRAGQLMHLKSCALFGNDSVLIGGQANYTHNSFSGAWLETDVLTRARCALKGFRQHFEALWHLPGARALEPATLSGRCLDGLRSATLWGFELAGLRP